MVHSLNVDHWRQPLYSLRRNQWKNQSKAPSRYPRLEAARSLYRRYLGGLLEEGTAPLLDALLVRLRIKEVMGSYAGAEGIGSSKRLNSELS